MSEICRLSGYFTWTWNRKMWYSLLALDKAADDRIVARVTVNGDSPWFSGHFPDNPVLPGIAQLYMIAEVIARSNNKELYIQRLNRVKFKRLVRPDEVLEIHAASTGSRYLYAFRMIHQGEDVSSGMMLLADK